MTVPPRWQVALGYALVGEQLPLSDTVAPDPARLVTELADLGWDADRVASHARAVVADEQPWPHPIPAELRQGCGAAQLFAGLGRVRELLGVVTLEARPPSARKRLNLDEQRLLRDVPPHW